MKIVQITNICFILCLTFFVLNCQKGDDRIYTSKIDSLNRIIDSLIILHMHDIDGVNGSQIHKNAENDQKKYDSFDKNQADEWGKLVTNDITLHVKWRMRVSYVDDDNTYVLCKLFDDNRWFLEDVYVYGSSFILHRGDILIVTGTASYPKSKNISDLAMAGVHLIATNIINYGME